MHGSGRDLIVFGQVFQGKAMKLLIAVIVLVILGGGVWNLQKTNRSASDESLRVGAESGAGKVDATLSETKAVVQDAKSQAATVVDVAADPAVPGDAGSEVNQSATATPFTTIVETESVAEPQFAEPDTTVSESADTIVDTAAANGDASDNADRGNIVVPQSYSVTDAAKYYIPKEQRGPGRLGGPPPLDFPGGPSDPDSAGSETFLPPPAPGN